MTFLLLSCCYTFSWNRGEYNEHFRSYKTIDQVFHIVYESFWWFLCTIATQTIDMGAFWKERNAWMVEQWYHILLLISIVDSVEKLHLIQYTSAYSIINQTLLWTFSKTECLIGTTMVGRLGQQIVYSLSQRIFFRSSSKLMVILWA